MWPCGVTFPVMNFSRATPILERERRTYPDNFLAMTFYLLQMIMVQVMGEIPGVGVGKPEDLGFCP